uniref:Uncharacterized protein n=1 Tax=Escherichia coli TaxID=562 RepID=A0A2H5BZV7_ECOLX|nr:hypothetical protein PCOV6_00183 [Escherichia coli]
MNIFITQYFFGFNQVTQSFTPQHTAGKKDDRNITLLLRRVFVNLWINTRAINNNSLFVIDTNQIGKFSSVFIMFEHKQTAFVTGDILICHNSKTSQQLKTGRLCGKYSAQTDKTQNNRTMGTFSQKTADQTGLDGNAVQQIWIDVLNNFPSLRKDPKENQNVE